MKWQNLHVTTLPQHLTTWANLFQRVKCYPESELTDLPGPVSSKVKPFRIRLKKDISFKRKCHSEHLLQWEKSISISIPYLQDRSGFQHTSFPSPSLVIHWSLAVWYFDVVPGLFWYSYELSKQKFNYLELLRLKAIICFAPFTHSSELSSQYLGIWAVATSFEDVEPVTLHLYPAMYLFRGCWLLRIADTSRGFWGRLTCLAVRNHLEPQEMLVISINMDADHCGKQLTQSQAQVQPPSGQAGRSWGTS